MKKKEFLQYELEQFYVLVKSFYPDAVVTCGTCIVKSADTAYEVDMYLWDGRATYSVWKEKEGLLGRFSLKILETRDSGKLADVLKSTRNAGWSYLELAETNYKGE